MIVDWSAAGTPKTGRDSIWICAAGRDGVETLLENPPTRHAARALLCELLGDAVRRGERVLAGFDFPFGYPAGFAARLGVAGSQPWRAVWDEIAAVVEFLATLREPECEAAALDPGKEWYTKKELVAVLGVNGGSVARMLTRKNLQG